MGLLLVESVAVGEGSSQCAITAPLQMCVRYQVRRSLVNPEWTVTYVADVASERVGSILAESRASHEHLRTTTSATDAGTKTLVTGVTYELTVSIPTSVMQKEVSDKIALKYLLQIGAFTFVLSGEESEAHGTERVEDSLHVVCQIRSAADATLVRTILQ